MVEKNLPNTSPRHMPPGTKNFKKVIYHIKWISMINCEPLVVPAFRLGTKGYNTYHVSRLLSRSHCYIFFPRVILYNFFLLLLIYGGLGFGVLGLGSYFGFLGLGLSVDGVLGLWCGAFWVFWVWALYINIKE